MKCIYQGCDCRYVDTSGMNQTKSCKECELYDPHDIRISHGCVEPAIAIILIIILLLV